MRMLRLVRWKSNNSPMWVTLEVGSHVTCCNHVFSGRFIKQVLICLPLYHFLPFFLSSFILLSCVSYSNVIVSKGRLLGPAMRGLCCATEINAPLGMICLVHVCLVDSTPVQGATEHVQDRTAQWRFIYLPLHMPGVWFTGLIQGCK